MTTQRRHGFGMIGFLIAVLGLLVPLIVCLADDFDELNKLEKEFNVHWAAGRYREAEPIGRTMLAISERSFQDKPEVIASALDNLANIYQFQAKYAEAESLHQRSLKLREKALPLDHPDVAFSLDNLARLYQSRGRYAEVEPLYQRALRLREKALGPDHPLVSYSLNGLAIHYKSQGKYSEAEPLYQRALKLREKSLGSDHSEVAESVNNLANLYRHQAKYAEAESLYQRALKQREKALGPDHPSVAYSLNNLALLYSDQAKNAEAEPLYQRAFKVLEKALGPDHPDVAQSLYNLALLYERQGKYAEAEPLYQQSLKLREKALGPDHSHVADSLNNLAVLYMSQGKNTEAEPLYQRALKLREKALGPDHPHVADSLNNLAILYERKGMYAKAEPLYRRALKLRENSLGPDHPHVGQILSNLAVLYKSQDKFAEAELLYLRVLKLHEKVPGPDHSSVAYSLKGLASLYESQGKYAEAEPLIDRAIAIRDRTGVAPGKRFNSYRLRAQIAWKQDRKREALTDLRQALDLAEEQRVRASGSEQDRAQVFSEYAIAFETMVDWQMELGDLREAFSAIERGHSRSLLDEMAVAGTDLNVGRPVAERERLRQQGFQLNQKVLQLERQLSVLPAKDNDRSSELERSLAEARKQLYEHYREERVNSPVYRNLLTSDAGVPTIDEFRNRLIGERGLLLIYLLGQDNGYVLSIGPSHERLSKLMLDEAVSKALGVEPGPLTAERMSKVMVREESSGVLPMLRQPDSAIKAMPQLFALWQALIPEADREALAGGKVSRLSVIPDGPLSLLPFETLVVQDGDHPQYLLDVGPPIQYAPSATVLFNLTQRRAAPVLAGLKPVLTVGDPAYAGTSNVQVASRAASALDDITTRARYRGAQGNLNRLPHSGVESIWVADSFTKAGINVGRLAQAQATEASVRYNLPGRRIIHLACHGLVDQAYGNLFGSLAFAPGKDDNNPADDGFLTLAELYELDLKSCELAILSACETNFGPQQKGEGTWALSRGFLVAGAKRVVASNWLVDDEAAASLISYFCAGLARSEQKGETVNHAECLHAAKKWVRQQDKWRSPYYWSTFVLVGPQ